MNADDVGSVDLPPSREELAEFELTMNMARQMMSNLAAQCEAGRAWRPPGGTLFCAAAEASWRRVAARVNRTRNGLHDAHPDHGRALQAVERGWLKESRFND